MRTGGHLFDSLPPPTWSSCFVFAIALLEGGGPIQARALGAGRPQFRLSRVDASRISQVSRWSILCLCSAPRPRSNRCALTLAVTSMLPPLHGTTKASDDGNFGAHSRSCGTCSPTLRVSCCHSRARLASGWLAGLYREGVDPLDHYERFQITW